MIYRGNCIEFDDLSRAHMTVISEVPNMIADEIYNMIQVSEPIDILNIKVEPYEMSSFIAELVSEVKERKNCLTKNKVMRSSDLTYEDSLMKTVYVTVLLPRTLTNQNLKTLVNVLHKTTPLNIHFIMVVPVDANDKIREAMISSTYWRLETETNTLYTYTEEVH